VKARLKGPALPEQKKPKGGGEKEKKEVPSSLHAPKKKGDERRELGETASNCKVRKRKGENSPFQSRCRGGKGEKEREGGDGRN